MGKLEGKVAIVTGAASGIGKATVELFRGEGATVIGADVAAGADVRCDAGNATEMKRLIDDVATRHDGLDIIFANAGISGGFKSIAEQTAADWTEILRINLIGPFLAIKHGAPQLKARGGGSIICTASTAGLRAGAGSAAYSASKAGVISLVQTAAQQLSGTGVRVNAICPGIIETGMTKPIFDFAREIGKPVGRLKSARARRNCRGNRASGPVSRRRQLGLCQRDHAGRRRRPRQQPSDGTPVRHQDVLI